MIDRFSTGMLCGIALSIMGYWAYANKSDVDSDNEPRLGSRERPALQAEDAIYCLRKYRLCYYSGEPIPVEKLPENSSFRWLVRPALGKSSHVRSFKYGDKVPDDVVALAKCEVPGEWKFGGPVFVAPNDFGGFKIRPVDTNDRSYNLMIISGAQGCTINLRTIDAKWPDDAHHKIYCAKGSTCNGQEGPLTGTDKP